MLELSLRMHLPPSLQCEPYIPLTKVHVKHYILPRRTFKYSVKLFHKAWFTLPEWDLSQFLN